MPPERRASHAVPPPKKLKRPKREQAPPHDPSLRAHPPPKHKSFGTPPSPRRPSATPLAPVQSVRPAVPRAVVNIPPPPIGSPPAALREWKKVYPRKLPEQGPLGDPYARWHAGEAKRARTEREYNATAPIVPGLESLGAVIRGEPGSRVHYGALAVDLLGLTPGPLGIGKLPVVAERAALAERLATRAEGDFVRRGIVRHYKDTGYTRSTRRKIRGGADVVARAADRRAGGGGDTLAGYGGRFSDVRSHLDGEGLLGDGVMTQVKPVHRIAREKHLKNLRAKTNPRFAEEGKPPNPVTKTTAGHHIAGEITPQDWVARVQHVFDSPQEIEGAARWYETFEPLFRKHFGKDADRVMRAFAVSQANASPSGGLASVLRAMHKIDRGEEVGSIGSVVADSIEAALKGGMVDKKMAAKLSDFTDALRGKKRRTWMGNRAAGGAPAPVDVWGLRDLGYIDKGLLSRRGGQLKGGELNRAKQILTDHGVDLTKLTHTPGVASGSRYERAAEKYEEITNHLNEVGFNGRSDWTPAQTQALGWSGIQRFFGNVPEDLVTAIEKGKASAERGIRVTPIKKYEALIRKTAREQFGVSKPTLEQQLKAEDVLHEQMARRSDDPEARKFLALYDDAVYARKLAEADSGKLFQSAPGEFRDFHLSRLPEESDADYAVRRERARELLYRDLHQALNQHLGGLPDLPDDFGGVPDTLPEGWHGQRNDLPHPNVLNEARDWLTDVLHSEDLTPEDLVDHLGKLDDDKVVRLVERHYEGGWKAFAAESARAQKPFDDAAAAMAAERGPNAPPDWVAPGSTGAGDFEAEALRGIDVPTRPHPRGMEQSMAGGYRGAVEPSGDGRYILHLFANADASTVIHEMGHAIKRLLSPEDIATLAKHGLNDEETFARTFEAYFRNGEAPTMALRKVFRTMSQLLRGVYADVREIGETNLNPDTKAVFDHFMTKGGTSRKPPPLPLVEGALFQPPRGRPVHPLLNPAMSPPPAAAAVPPPPVHPLLNPAAGPPRPATGGPPQLPPSPPPTAAAAAPTNPMTVEEAGAEVMGGMGQAERLTREQTKLRRIEDGYRTREYRRRLAAGHSEEAARAALKGPMPTFKWERFTNIDNDLLAEMLLYIRKHPKLQGPDKVYTAINTEDALRRIVEGGRLPRPFERKLLRDVFGDDTDDIVKSISRWKQLGRLALDIYSLPRTLASTLDLSFPLRQGLGLAVSHPVIWGKQFWPMLKSFGNSGVLEDIQRGIAEDPNSDLMQRAGIPFTDLGTHAVAGEEAFPSSLAERVPYAGAPVKASNRAYVAFGNKSRQDYFNWLIDKVRTAYPELDLDSPEADKLLQHLGRVVGNATGRGQVKNETLARAMPILNQTLFSPRLLKSRLDVISYPATMWHMNKVARREAYRQLGGIVALASGIMTLTALAAGKDIRDMPGPRNADWGKIKVGNKRFDMLGGFQQPFRLLAQLSTGTVINSVTGEELSLGTSKFGAKNRLSVLGRFAETKLAPPPGFAVDLLRGTDFERKPFSLKSELEKRLTPLLLQDAYEASKEGDDFSAKVALALAIYGIGVFGVGAQVYGPPLGRPKSNLPPARVPSFSGGGGGADYSGGGGGTDYSGGGGGADYSGGG